MAGFVYAGHCWFGGNSSFGALSLAAVQALLLACLIIAIGAPQSLRHDRTTLVLALLLLSTIAAGAMSMSPAYLGGPHPVWSFVTGQPAGAIDRSAVLIEIIKLLGLAAMFMIGLALGASPDTAKRIVKCIVWGGGAFALVAIVLFLGRTGGPTYVDPRLNAQLSSANCAATVFGMLSCLALPLLMGRPRRRESNTIGERASAYALPAALLLLLLSALVLTASRGGAVSTLVGACAFLALLAATGRVKLPVALAGLGAFALLAFGLMAIKAPLALERLGGILDGHDSRAAIFAQVWLAIQQAPLQGYGLGGFAELHALLLSPSSFNESWAIRDVHNVYLQWLVDGGILGAAPMFALIAIVIGQSLLGLFGNVRDKTWLAAMLAADVVVLAHGVTDFALQVPSIAAMWALLLGIQFGWVRRPSRARSV